MVRVRGLKHFVISLVSPPPSPHLLIGRPIFSSRLQTVGVMTDSLQYSASNEGARGPRLGDS